MKSKKIFALCLVCLMAFALFAGCNETGSDESDAGPLSAKDIISKSAEAMNDIDNYKATMLMDMGMTSQGQTMEMTMNAEMDAFMDPLKIKMAMNMEDPSFGSIDMDTYIVQENDNLAVYTQMFGTWSKTTQPFSEELLSQYSQTEYIALFNDSLKQADIVAEEAVNGIDCWKIDVIIDAPTMMDMLGSMQGGEDLASMIPADMVESMGDMTASLWISQDNYYQIKMDMDLTAAMAPAMQGMGVELTKMAISMMTFDFGNATDFTLPEEAANAIETAL